MGCGASQSSKVVGGDPKFISVHEAWEQAHKTVEQKKVKPVVIKRTGWKTVRIFVSSTFKDFHQEREILVKKVFPDLRLWCEENRLELVECDLRWGVPEDFTNEAKLRACLGEIDRCYQDNVMPFFVNMTSERIGWVPDDIPVDLADEYRWIKGLSVTEMEIMHGAYRNDNPNALFLLRDPIFLKRVPEEHKAMFIEHTEIAPYKLEMLRKMIRSRFSKDRVKSYNVEYNGYNEVTKRVELGGLEDTFSKVVYNFFKKRIAMQYPPPSKIQDPYVNVAAQHEAFMKNRCPNVFGRETMISEIEEYIDGVGNDVPFMLLGNAGSGKSSIMAKIADNTATRALQGKIPGAGNKSWHVFYHFVGAVPGSTELEKMLKRLLKEIGVVTESTMPTDLDNACQLCCGALNNPSTRPTIVIVDALNQFDEDQGAELVSWLPRKLAPSVRVVVSMIPDTMQYKSLVQREPMPQKKYVAPLDHEAKLIIVKELLGRYNKQLDDSQMQSLLAKTSSSNPLWLSIACEELRVFGLFRQISDKINKLPDGLLELEAMVLERFEEENGGTLMRAALCLLEVSARGLLEVELLQILADEDMLTPIDNEEVESVGKDKGAEKSSEKKKDRGTLPAYKWAEVYRALKPFVRPFGDSGEGRLDFYHRSLSKAVRKRYFKDKEDEDRSDIYKWWHTLLADHFEETSRWNRKIEELPVHLIAINDQDRLEKFLLDWEVFDEYYDEEYSTQLIAFWRKGADYTRMEECYMTKIDNMANQPNLSKDDKDKLSRRYEVVARFFSQAGRYAKAEELLARALKLEEEEFGSRPDRMVEMYYQQAFIKDEVMKLEEYMYRSQLPRMKAIIELFLESTKIRRTMPGELQKFKLGLALNRMAFYYSGYSLRGGDDYMSASEAQAKAMKAVNEAIEIFTELKDDLHIGDSMTTKGVCYQRACAPQIKCYKEAEEIFERCVGLHICYDRLLLNMAIYYEESGDYYTAFTMFRKWYDACVELYGIKHPKSQRPINTLREPMYKRIAHEKNISIPELYSD